MKRDGEEKKNFSRRDFIWANRYDERFASESPSWFAHRASMGFNIWDWSDTQRDAGYPCIPFYLIFDEKTRLAGGAAVSVRKWAPCRFRWPWAAFRKSGARTTAGRLNWGG